MKEESTTPQTPPPLDPGGNPGEENTLLLKIALGIAAGVILCLLSILVRKVWSMPGDADPALVTVDTIQENNVPVLPDTALLMPPPPPPQPAYAKALRFTFRETSYVGFRAVSDSVHIRMFLENEEGTPYGTLYSVREVIEVEGQNFLFATNGGIFHADLSPVGLCIIDGEEVSPLNKEMGSGNFYLKPNGVFYTLDDGGVGVLETEAFRQAGLVPRFATQSGPMLLIDGAVHPAFNADSPNLRIRSGVGMINDREVVFLVSTEPVRFFDFAMAFRDRYKCRNALYLDGVISKMLIGDAPTGPAEFSTIITVSE